MSNKGTRIIRTDYSIFGKPKRSDITALFPNRLRDAWVGVFILQNREGRLKKFRRVIRAPLQVAEKERRVRIRIPSVEKGWRFVQAAVVRPDNWTTRYWQDPLFGSLDRVIDLGYGQKSQGPTPRERQRKGPDVAPFWTLLSL
jgi:hypothetical protein